MMVIVICVHYKLIQCGSVYFSLLCLNLINLQENEVCTDEQNYPTFPVRLFA